MKEKIEAVKKNVTIPDYFKEIIIPELSDYYSLYTVDFDYKPTALCPIHDENTPSFRYFEETNSYYCYGCQAGGDIINLHERFMEVSFNKKPNFIETVKFLYDYFIIGNRTNTIAREIKSEQEDKKESEDKAEILVYGRYIDKVERQLIMEQSLDVQQKIDIYNEIDTINELIRAGHFKPREYMGHIKNTIRKALK